MPTKSDIVSAIKSNCFIRIDAVPGATIDPSTIGEIMVEGINDAAREIILMFSPPEEVCLSCGEPFKSIPNSGDRGRCDACRTSD